MALTQQQLDATKKYKAGEITAEQYKQQYITPGPVFKKTANPVEEALKNQIQPVQQPAQMLSAQAPQYQPPPIQDYSGQISQQYGTATQAMVDKIRNAIAQSKIEQQGIIQKAPQQFEPLRGQSELAKGQQLRSALERSSLLGDRGGIGRSEALQTQTAGENRLNEIKLQQQNVIDTANQKIASLEAQGRFEEANVVASQKLAELQALMQESQRRDELARQNEQLMYNRTQDAQNIARQETAQTQEQERADFQTKILANYQNISAFVNQLVAQGAPQWQIDQANAARIQKIIENNLDPNTGKPKPVDNTQAIWDQALTKWNANIPLTQQEMQILGTTTATKPVKMSTGGSGSSTTVTQDRNYQLDRWQILGVADQAIADAWGVPVGTPVSNKPTETPEVDTSSYENYINNYFINKDEITGQKSINRQGVAKYIYDLMAKGKYAEADGLMNIYGITEDDIYTVERFIGNKR